MIDTKLLEGFLNEYKKDFHIMLWKNEKYKWEAVKHFQDRWDIDAPIFLDMFMKATDKTFNLLASRNFLPRGMMREFIVKDAETVKAMFINLYDESKDLAERVQKFQSDSDAMRVKYDDGTWKQHYQSTNAISTYLWLRYPDKYYIYKYSEYRAVARALKSNFLPKKGYASENLIGGFSMYDEVCAYLAKDEDLVKILRNALTDTCYPDPALRTLTIDVGFYITNYYPAKVEWFPSNYNPNITTERWLELLADNKVFTDDSLKIMKRLKDHGGAATCTQLAIKYGLEMNFYNVGSTRLAKRVADATSCLVMKTDDEGMKWWPVLYVGKKAQKDEEGSYTWKLRDELSRALDKYDLSKVTLYETPPVKPVDDHDKHGYWWLNANPRIWSFSGMKVGESQSYTLKNENGNKRRIYQNFLDANAGDFVIGYESHPVKKVVALARINQKNDGEKLAFEKTEGLVTPIDYGILKSSPELKSCEYFANPQGSLFKLTKDEYNFILDVIREENPTGIIEKTVSYTKKDFLEDVFMTSEHFDTLTSLLENKQNLILQGAPGVGKTYAAKRLAYAIMNEMDDSRIEIIQFHQNYSYEDFMMGYRPQGDGFELQNGVFYRFCQRAANTPDKSFFFIIDEINRGNMSKIFGELLMLIEKDYRGTKATLAYNGMPFSVPKNLYIIGMMNTADRSLAMIDYALRRRFSFYEMQPGFSTEGFKVYQDGLDNETFNTLIERIRELNKEITADNSLGKGFCIGHSYFCNQKECTEDWMKEVVEYDILPMLSEYWFDEPTKLQRWENMLHSVFND